MRRACRGATLLPWPTRRRPRNRARRSAHGPSAASSASVGSGVCDASRSMSSSRRRTRAASCWRSSTAARAAAKAFASRAAMAASTSWHEVAGSSRTDASTRSGGRRARPARPRAPPRHRPPVRPDEASTSPPRRATGAASVREFVRRPRPHRPGIARQRERDRAPAASSSRLASTLCAESSVRRRSWDHAARARSTATRASIHARRRCKRRKGDGLQAVDAHRPQREPRVLDDLRLERAEAETVPALKVGEQSVDGRPRRDWLGGQASR